MTAIRNKRMYILDISQCNISAVCHTCLSVQLDNCTVIAAAVLDWRCLGPLSFVSFNGNSFTQKVILLFVVAAVKAVLYANNTISVFLSGSTSSIQVRVVGL